MGASSTAASGLPRARFVSMDQFRGLTILLMFAVHYAGGIRRCSATSPTTSVSSSSARHVGLRPEPGFSRRAAPRRSGPAELSAPPRRRSSATGKAAHPVGAGDLWQPSPSPGRVGLRIVSFGAVSVFTHVTACQLADGLTPPCVSQAPTASLPPQPLG